MLAKINVLLFLAVVIVAECLIAYFYLPSASATAAITAPPPPPEKKTEKEKETEKAAHGKESKEPAKESAKHEKTEKASGHGKGEKTDKHGAKHGEAAPAEEAEEAEPPDTLEVDLGEFSVTVYQPVSNSTLRIDFHLFGTVPGEQGKEFTKLFEETKHRFRDQVLMIVRSAEMTDLTDAGLGLIKRRIQDRGNKLLGKPLLQSVIISDFAFVEH